MNILPMMAAIASLAAGAPVGGAEGTVPLFEGERSFVADFTGATPPSAFIAEMPLPCSLIRDGEVSIDLFIEDIGQFLGAYFYFGSGGGWYRFGVAPEKCGEWETIKIPVAKLGVEGAPDGLSRIQKLLIRLMRAGTGTSAVKVRDIVLRGTVSPEPTEEERRERAAAEKERVLAMPGRAGERRFAWTHNEFGPYRGDWDRAVAEIRAFGFTDLIVNMSWGASAAYWSVGLPPAPTVAEYGDSLETCLSACRNNGVRLHVWRMCWRIRWKTLKEDIDRMEADGLLQRDRSGKALRDWLCPSDPRNREREIEAMVELAGKGVDGIHFDTIRYSSDETCFCDGCRARFGEFLGRALPDDWAREVQGDAALKAKWQRFRAENITAVVREVSRRVRETHPGVEISAAVFFDPQQNREALGQDWTGWCREGLLDFACPMDYTKSLAIFRSRLRMQNENRSGTPLYPGIGLSLFPADGGQAGRCADQIAAAREEGFGGFTIFQYQPDTAGFLQLLREGPCRD